MSEEETDDAPAVPLGDGRAVEGVPVARIAARLTWPQTHSDIVEKFGDHDIRTPDGPQPLESVLADVETAYFDRRQTFVEGVFDVIGREPVATE